MEMELLKFNKFSLLPNGIVKSGWVTYNADTETGTIYYAYEVNVRILLFPLSFKGNDVLKVDPKGLRSENFKIGTQVSMGPVTAEVVANDGKHGRAKIFIQNQDINEMGYAEFDVTGEFIELLSLKEDGTVKGYSVTVELVRV